MKLRKKRECNKCDKHTSEGCPRILIAFAMSESSKGSRIIL